MDRLTALRVFRHVAELNSFAEAGRRLGLSPAAISKNIAELEAHVGARLINRTTRRMALTEEGRLYLEHVTRGLDALAEADHALCPIKAAPSGTLRVSAPMTVTLTQLSEAIPDFLARYPDLKLDLHLDDRRVDMVREGFDLAVRGSDNLEDSSLIARKLAVMPHVLCAAPSYFQRHGKPETPSELKDLDHIRFSLSGHADAWEFSKDGRTERIAVAARYSVSSSLAVRDALRAGFGISLVPRPYVESDLRDGRLQSALEEWSTVETTLYAVYSSRQHLAPKIRAFLDFLIEAFNREAR
jgi:DNA-binding transcriptional LysR family regulator